MVGGAAKEETAAKVIFLSRSSWFRKSLLSFISWVQVECTASPMNSPPITATARQPNPHGCSSDVQRSVKDARHHQVKNNDNNHLKLHIIKGERTTPSPKKSPDFLIG